MALSYQTAVSDGTMSLLDISIGYLERDDITVYFDEVLTTAWMWSGVSDKRILFLAPVPNGVTVLVKRITDSDRLRHEFSQGAAFTSSTLDEDLLQNLYIAQEAQESNLNGDFFTDINLHGFKIKNLADAVDPGDAMNLGQYQADIDGTFAAKEAAEAAAAAAEAAAAAIPGNFANTSDPAKGDALIGVKQPLTGAVARTQHSKNLEDISVLDFGAVGDGVTDDTAAFTAAQAAAPFIRVPAGLSCKVGAGLNYWQFYGDGRVFEPGVAWDLNRSPQTRWATQKVYKDRTFGIYEQAAGMSVSINSSDAQTRQNTQILGTSTQGLATTYFDRDHVALYVQSWSYAPDTTDATTTYTATTLTHSTVSTLNAAGKLSPGMIIDTQHATPLTGRIQSVTGNVITVDAWYTRVTGAAATPANGTGATINPNTKIWAQNSNLFLSGNAGNRQAQKGTGFELGLSCDASTSGVGVWGFDVVTFGGKPEAHFISRGSRTYSFKADTGADYGFRSNSNTRGFSSNGDVISFENIQGGVTVWNCNSDGSTISNGVKRIGVLPTQCTNAAFVNVGPLAPAYGGLYWVSGFNTAGGAEGNFLVMIRSGAVATVSTSDGTGLAIAFQAVGRQLQIKCNNAGTFQFVAHGFSA